MFQGAPQGRLNPLIFSLFFAADKQTQRQTHIKTDDVNPVRVFRDKNELNPNGWKCFKEQKSTLSKERRNVVIPWDFFFFFGSISIKYYSETAPLAQKKKKNPTHLYFKRPVKWLISSRMTVIIPAFTTLFITHIKTQFWILLIEQNSTGLFHFYFISWCSWIISPSLLSELCDVLSKERRIRELNPKVCQCFTEQKQSLDKSRRKCCDFNIVPLWNSLVSHKTNHLLFNLLSKCPARPFMGCAVYWATAAFFSPVAELFHIEYSEDMAQHV